MERGERESNRERDIEMKRGGEGKERALESETGRLRWGERERGERESIRERETERWRWGESGREIGSWAQGEMGREG